MHIGLRSADSIENVVIKWPDGKQQTIKNVRANQVLKIQHKDATEAYTWQHPVIATNTLFTDVSDSLKANIIHEENDYVDFNIQKLLPHKLSDYTPGLTAGDVNGDGLDDIITGGSKGYSAQVMLQQNNGTFITRPLVTNATIDTKITADKSVLLIDADGDGDND